MFNIGDKVIVIKKPEKCRSSCECFIGKIGTITAFGEATPGKISVKEFPETTSWCSAFTPESLRPLNNEEIIYLD
jgi:hypothetical protein